MSAPASIPPLRDVNLRVHDDTTRAGCQFHNCGARETINAIIDVLNNEVQAANPYTAGAGVEALAKILARAGLITYQMDGTDLTLGGLTMGSPAICRSTQLHFNGLDLAGLRLGTPRPIPNMRPNGLNLAGLSLGTPRPIPGLKPNGLNLAGLSLGSPAAYPITDVRLFLATWGSGIFVSPKNTGDSWEQKEGGSESEWYHVACSKTGQYAIAGGGIDFPGLLKTSADYGGTWTTRAPGGPTNADWTAVAVNAAGDVMYAYVSNGDIYDKLFKSTNNGVNWSELTKPASSLGAYGMACDDAGNNVIIGANYGRLWTSANGGTSWTERRPFGDTNQYYYKAAMDADGSFMVVGHGNARTIAWSTDSGANWNTKTFTDAGNYIGNVACNSTGSVILVASFGGRLWLSKDTGSSWNEVRPSGDTNHLWAALTVDKVGAVLTAGNYDGKMYRSKDGGTTWTDVSPAGLSSGIYGASCSRE